MYLYMFVYNFPKFHCNPTLQSIDFRELKVVCPMAAMALGRRQVLDLLHFIPENKCFAASDYNKNSGKLCTNIYRN